MEILSRFLLNNKLVSMSKFLKEKKKLRSLYVTWMIRFGLVRKPLVLVPAGLHFLQICHLLSLVFLRSQRVRTLWIEFDLVVVLEIHGVSPWMTGEAFKEEGKHAFLAAEAWTGIHKVLFIIPNLLE